MVIRTVPLVGPHGAGQVACIRDAAIADAAKLIEHVQQVSMESDYLSAAPGEFMLSVEQEEAFIRRFGELDNALFLVADVGGEMVGVLTFRAGTRERMRHIGELGMSVIRDYWGQGIGKALLQALIDWAPSAGVTKLVLRVRSDNQRAIALYRRVGFVTEGVQSRGMQISGRYHDLEFMGLEL